MEPINEMDAVARKMGTDKSGNKERRHHGYVRWYEPLFSNRREIVKNVLEIGVGGGGSLRLWEHWFPNASIRGVDIQNDAIRQAKGRVSISILDAGVQANWDAFNNAEPAMWDIIIDDGSHREEHVWTTLRALWKRLSPGGLYIVEDLGCPQFTGESPILERNEARKLSETIWRNSYPGRMADFFRETPDAHWLSILPSFNHRITDTGVMTGQCLAILSKNEAR